MAGVLFVVCVPTAQHEAELEKHSSRPSADDEKAAAEGRHKFLKSAKKSDFHKSEPHLFNNQQQAATKAQQAAANNPKLFRAVTESALDTKASQEALNIFNNQVHNNLLVPPQNQGAQINNDLAKSTNAVHANSASSILNLVVPTIGGSPLPTTPQPLPAQTPQPPPPEEAEDEEMGLKMVPMEKVLLNVLSKLKIENAVWCPGKNNNFYQVIFSTGSGEPCEDCLQCLQDCGIGQKFSSVVSVIPCSLYYEGQSEESPTAIEGSSDDDFHGSDEKLKDSPNKVTAWSKFVASVRARLTVAQVVEQVRANAELTFDFCMLLIVAGLVAALGLVENSSVILVASMLISPLMGPILAGTFGTVIQDRRLQRVGVLHELFGLLMCLVIGFFFGLVIASVVDHWGPGDWPTQEMQARGATRSLWVGVLIALPSGAGVALSVLGGNAGSLVGVAISASLLPPAVNAGLLWALAVVELLKTTSDPYHTLSLRIQDAGNETAQAIDAATESPKVAYMYFNDNKPAELAALGAVSLCLTLLNILCIFIAGIIVLKIKEVAPKSSRDDLDVFWKHDIKIARDYNKTMHGEEGKNLGKQLMDELAGMSSEKLNACVDEATRDTILDRIRRISFMNGNNEHTYTGSSLGRNESTWSPNSATQERATIRDLEDLYATLTGQRPRSYVPLPMPMTAANAMRRRSFSVAPRRTSFSISPSRRRESVSRPNSRVPNVGLATITETNSPAGTPVAKHGTRRPSASPQQKKEKMRFVVTPALDDSLPNTPVTERKTSTGPILRKGDYQAPSSGSPSHKKFSLG